MILKTEHKPKQTPENYELKILQPPELLFDWQTVGVDST